MKVVEFYCGIGGLHYSLRQATSREVEKFTVVAAFDINPLSNKVYRHNFNLKPSASDIGRLSAADLDALGGDIWLLSPPCQPYTRQGKQLGSNDPRAESFIVLLEKLQFLENPPKYLLVENVVGFEQSATRSYLIETLKSNNYVTQEFLISPSDLGVPYSRARYFCLAKLQPLQFQCPKDNFQITKGPPQVPESELQLFRSSSGSGLRPLSEFLLEGQSEEYAVKESVSEKYMDCIDIVTPGSKMCCCFTKSYFRYMKGTRSLVATNAVALQEGENEAYLGEDGRVHLHLSSEFGHVVEKPNKEILRELNLRYFSPQEVANLHSFPAEFTFPEDLTKKQRYALLGNSLSVAVVRHLLLYLLKE
jgi:tRNA (cytosine38-C5)-methyltransferase